MIQGNCPGCSKPYSVPDDWAGKSATCPACKTKFALAALASEPAPEEDAGGYGLVDEPEPEHPPAVAAPGSELLDTANPLDVPLPAKRPKKKPKSTDEPGRPARRRVTPADVGGRWYLLLALALLPLAWSLLLARDDLLTRMTEAVETNPAILDVLEAKSPNSPAAFYDVVTSQLPEGRLKGAHLPRKTIWHWVYAVLGAVAMFGLLLVAFPRGTTTPARMAGVALGIATGGVALLLVVQVIAEFSMRLPMGGHVLWSALVGMLRLIGYSYRAAIDPESGFILSFVGFTLGVGLCEELIKLIPVLIYFRHEAELDWRGAAAWGAAGGLGFGVAEGIIYSADFYNGIAPLDIYLVRFVSCVALHAIWSATAGILAWQHQALMEGELDWHECGLIVLYVVGGPAVLHGLYDTLLKKEYLLAALLTALVSVGALAALIELNRNAEAPA